jgi:hypothetical protein
MAFVTVDISAGRFPLIEVFQHLVRNSGTAGIGLPETKPIASCEGSALKTS